MAGSLASRLSRIRAAAKVSPPPSTVRSGPDTAARETAFGAEWESLSPFVRRRAAATSRPLILPSSLSPALAALCPGSSQAFPGGTAPEAGTLLFFDLETTGLSGGAGTVAFLAAFARASGGDGDRLSLVQYLLLDYPGESEFLEAVRAEFSSAGPRTTLVTYNGRSFDSQILRTRCLMNALPPPDPPHLDLVYPARRLWRRSLESCSLSVIEREVLSVDRGDDLPGAEAPDAWFEFLKRGETARLLRVCDHNLRDIEGLASLLLRLDGIARDPVGALSRATEVSIDVEGLALRWLAAAKAERAAGTGEAVYAADSRVLLERAFSAGSARAAFSLASLKVAEGDAGTAAELRAFVAESVGSPRYPAASPGLRAAACRLLALDAARRLRDRQKAAEWLERGLSSADLPQGSRRALEEARTRLGWSAQ